MEIKVETIIKTGESKRKILREVTDIFFQKMEYREKIK